jgi:hypothetical protein
MEALKQPATHKVSRAPEGLARLAFGLFLPPIAALLIWGRVGAVEPQTAIDCDLVDQAGRHFAYSFLFDPAKGTLSWVDGGEELKTERHTSAELLVSRRGKFGDSPAQVAYFDLALAAGGATMTYFRDATEAEIARCEKEQSAPDCKAPVALPKYNESGYCTFEERSAK